MTLKRPRDPSSTRGWYGARARRDADLFFADLLGLHVVHGGRAGREDDEARGAGVEDEGTEDAGDAAYHEAVAPVGMLEEEPTPLYVVEDDPAFAEALAAAEAYVGEEPADDAVGDPPGEASAYDDEASYWAGEDDTAVDTDDEAAAEQYAEGAFEGRAPAVAGEDDEALASEDFDAFAPEATHEDLGWEGADHELDDYDAGFAADDDEWADPLAEDAESFEGSDDDEAAGDARDEQRDPLEPSRRGTDALWRAAQQAVGGVVTRCGFFGPNNAALTTAQLRAAIVAAARTEWTRWHTAVGAPIQENDIAVFGHLVRYYLSIISEARPDTLAAMQTTAMAPTTSYAALASATTAAAQASEITRLRGVLFAGAPGTSTPTNLAAQVEDALANARQAHANSGGNRAWSAVWVCAVVRGVGISRGLEAMVGTRHVGRDELLLPALAHRIYAKEALLRTRGPNARTGTYQAFDPTSVAPEPGDIIIQDRRAVSTPMTFAGLATIGRVATHGDIVVEVTATEVITLGGNLIGAVDGDEGVRQRRYPLDTNGRLVVDRTRVFTQEDVAGTLPALPTTPVAATPLDTHSTARIFALLQPRQSCVAVPGQPYRGGVLT